MKDEEFYNLEKTEEGRRKLHPLLLEEIKEKMETLTESASAQNREELETIFPEALKRLEECQDVLFMYVFFADAPEKHFIKNMIDLANLGEEDFKKLLGQR